MVDARNVNWGDPQTQNFAILDKYLQIQRSTAVALAAGDKAPDFDLPAVQGKERSRFRLADLRGQKLAVVTFHPLDWTPTCEAQVPLLNKMRDQFAACGAQLVDISVDSIESHIAWQENEIGAMQFPLCSDFYPHGEVTKQFGILREGPPVSGISERAAFVVDREGIIRFAKIYVIGKLPDLAGLLEETRKISRQ
jgi:alkyl hydroperoxide reductase subunit AhpC